MKNVNLALSMLLFLTLACSSIATIRPLATATPSGAAASGSSSRTSTGFSAAKYVDDRWDAKILPAAANAMPLAKLLGAIKQNADAAGKQYGHRESGPYNFPVQVQGVVEKVDTESRAGTLVLKPGDVNDAEVRIAIGPVIRGTAVRDGSGVVPFSDFVNQIEYADVAEELNKRVAEQVLKPIDLKTLVGKTISVQGFFSLADVAKITITPVKLSVEQ
jgi:predicted lipoprotein